MFCAGCQGIIEKLQETSSKNIYQIIVDIQYDIRFASTSLLKDKSPDEIILPLIPNSRYNLIQRVSQSQSNKKCTESNKCLPAVLQKYGVYISNTNITDIY